MWSRIVRRAGGGEDGLAMVTAVLVLSVVALTTITVVQLSNHNAEQSAFDRNRLQAVNAAEAGLDDYLSGLPTVTPWTLRSSSTSSRHSPIRPRSRSSGPISPPKPRTPRSGSKASACGTPCSARSRTTSEHRSRRSPGRSARSWTKDPDSTIERRRSSWNRYARRRNG